MDVVTKVFVGLHIIGIASLLGGFLTQLKPMSAGAARFVPAMLHGALTMLVTGVILVYVKRDEEKVEKPFFLAVGLLTVVNIFIALLWT